MVWKPPAEVNITLLEALQQAEQEIRDYHRKYGFPDDLTHHTSRQLPRDLSLQGNYADVGNWCGSIVMHTLLFDHGLIHIFDRTSVRAEVYSFWGGPVQRSGKGPDNDRTNLLESILVVMGEEKGARTQAAWYLMRRYSHRYPSLTRQQLLIAARGDPSRDLYTADDKLADEILSELGRDCDIDVSLNLKRLFQEVRLTLHTPDYYTIHRITGCSKNNKSLKQLYWYASDKFRTLQSASKPQIYDV